MNARDLALVRDLGCETSEFSAIWKNDFSAIDPTIRRTARYVLQLLSSSTELQDDDDDDRLVNKGWKLISSLINEQAATTCFDSTVSNPDDSPPVRWKMWRIRVLTQLPANLLERLRAVDGDSPTNPCIALLGEVLSLNITEIRLLDFLEKRDSLADFTNFLRNLISVPNWRNRQLLARMLDADENDIRLALKSTSTLTETKLIEISRNNEADLEDFIEASRGLSEIIYTSPATLQELSDMLIEKAPTSEWMLTDFPHQQAAIDRLLPAIRRAAEGSVSGVNALLYGLPGTGKTEFARALAKAAGMTVFQVNSADEDGDGMGREGRLTAYLLAQQMLKNRRDAVILFDEVEDVFANDVEAIMRMLFNSEQSGGKEKGFMNCLLETNPVPTIWVTNNIRVMDAAFLRRFLLPVEFSVPPRIVRRKIVERHLGDSNLPIELLDELAADDKLAPAQFGDARRLLRLHNAQNDAQENGRIVREGVASIRRLLHGTKLPTKRRAITTFDTAFLNIAGGIAPQKIAAALGRTGRGSLCFYGPPGTGKTEFAHILADALDRELVVRQTSDLVSKYIGETEQNIARLFNTIDADHSILFIDEVDSFLRDRQEAERSWEITAVNELLQHMENFPGIFIAATNLMKGIDTAALRRFDFKLAFQPLSLPQRIAFFAREALGDIEAGTDLPSTIVSRLDQLETLTPGDFANVCRQRDILAEDLVPEEFLRRLVQECRWKEVA